MTVIRWNFRLVTDNDVEVLAVRGRHDGVRAMFATTTQFFQLDDLVVLIVAGRVLQAVKTATWRMSVRISRSIAPGKRST